MLYNYSVISKIFITNQNIHYKNIHLRLKIFISKIKIQINAYLLKNDSVFIWIFNYIIHFQNCKNNLKTKWRITMTKVFIDGKEGTTGLRIFDRLSTRDDVSLITLPEELRKDIDARKTAINSADIVFLCLPDAAAIEAVGLIENDNVRVIDASTAHRTNEGWAYGLPELSTEHRENVKNGKRVAVPGCHASGFVALVYPLVKNGLLPKDALLCCHSLTGYSGGGKKMIKDYEDAERDILLSTPRQYGLTQNHKHLKEMKHITMLDTAPMFSPIVDDFYSGMEMTVQLFASQLTKPYTVSDIKKVYSELYTTPILKYVSCNEKGLLAAGELSGKDNMIISVYGNEERILLTAVYDNLGKGASGAALECMNIMTGVDEYKGLYF